MPDAEENAPATPHKHLIKMVRQPNVRHFDPVNSHGRQLFKNKTRGLPEDQKFEVVTKDAAAIRKYLLGKQGVLGGVVTKVPIGYNTDSNTNKFVILMRQYQLVKFDNLKRQAYNRFACKLSHTDALPTTLWKMQELDPENNLEDRKDF